MKQVRLEEVESFRNSDVCFGSAYPIQDRDIDIAVVQIQGRYPDLDRVVNTGCKELAYVMEGKGEVTIEGKMISLKKGDAILIESGEKYFWEGELTTLMSCAPAWTPEQHKQVP